MTDFTNSFAERARREPIDIEHRGRTFQVRRSDARSGLVTAYLEVVLDGDVVGYLTEYGNNESGALPARLFGYAAPRLYRTLEDALDEIAPIDTAD